MTIGGVIGSENANGGRDFGTGAHAWIGIATMIFSSVCDLSLSVIADSMKPGATQLTVDVSRSDLLRQRLGKADHTGLGGAVIGLAWIADGAGDRSDIDDAAISTAYHLLVISRSVGTWR